MAGQRGYVVCISYLRNRPAAEAVVDAIVKEGGQALAVAADVAVERIMLHMWVKALKPMQRGGQAEEVAQAILWLLSNEAPYVTGTGLEVTGGR